MFGCLTSWHALLANRAVIVRQVIIIAGQDVFVVKRRLVDWLWVLRCGLDANVRPRLLVEFGWYRSDFPLAGRRRWVNELGILLCWHLWHAPRWL